MEGFRVKHENSPHFLRAIYPEGVNGGGIGYVDPLNGERFKVNECALRAFFISCQSHQTEKGLMASPQNKNATEKVALIYFGGGGGIRTPEGFYTLPVFKTGAINRSTTPPECFFV